MMRHAHFLCNAPNCGTGADTAAPGSGKDRP